MCGEREEDGGRRKWPGDLEKRLEEKMEMEAVWTIDEEAAVWMK